jgi:hypothetical protein
MNNFHSDTLHEILGEIMRRAVSMFAAVLTLLGSGFAQSQIPPIATPLANEEAVAFIKGKNLNSVRLAGGEPYLQFKEDGTMYGNNGGSSDSGKWKVEDGKLCMSWRKWEYEGCGKLVRVGDAVQHLYPDGASVHLIFKK